MLTEKDYCDYDTCVALKELGYNEKSNWWFSKYLNEDSGQMELVHICDNPAHLNYDSWGIVPKDFVIRPSHYEAQKWLREEKELFVNVELFGDYDRDADGKTLGTWVYYSYGIFNTTTAGFIREYDLCTEYQTYEEALLEGIKEAIKILKEEKE